MIDGTKLLEDESRPISPKEIQAYTDAYIRAISQIPKNKMGKASHDEKLKDFIITALGASLILANKLSEKESERLAGTIKTIQKICGDIEEV